jgi:hypothetical protein
MLTDAERDLLVVSTALFGWAPHDEALEATTKAVEQIVAQREITAVRTARNEIRSMLDGFAHKGRHTRATWAVAWLDQIIERLGTPAGGPV